MSDKTFNVTMFFVCIFLVSLLVIMVWDWADDAHEWHVAEDGCVDHGYYFVERFEGRFYCVEHHDDGSKTSYWLDRLEDR